MLRCHATIQVCARAFFSGTVLSNLHVGASHHVNTNTVTPDTTEDKCDACHSCPTPSTKNILNIFCQIRWSKELPSNSNLKTSYFGTQPSESCLFECDADLFCRLPIQTEHHGLTIKTCCVCGCDQSEKGCIAEQPHVILCFSRPGLSMSIQFADKCHNDTAHN